MPLAFLLALFVAVSPLLPVKADAACPSEMAAFWKLEETGAGPFVDEMGGPDATCDSCPAETSGKFGGAQLFSRSALTAVDVVGNADFDWNQDQGFTVEFWMKKSGDCVDFQNTASNEVIVGRRSPTNGLHWWVGIRCAKEAPRGVATFSVRDRANNTTFSVNGTRDLTDDQWHHIAAVRDASGGRILLYVDGKLDAPPVNATFTSDFKASDAALNIGWLDDEVEYHYTGVLDELAIYGGALSENVIRGHYYLTREYCADCAASVKIMPLGDSITEGNSSGAVPDDADHWIAYRKTLRLALQAAGLNVDFVGSQEGGGLIAPLEFTDTQHEGHNGFTAGDIAGNIDAWLLAGQPEVVLLHIGTNDLTSGIVNVDTLVNQVAGILNKIDTYDPDATVILARIINRSCDAAPCTDADDIQNTTNFNIKLQAMAEARIAAGDKIIVVNQENDAGIDYRSQGAGGDMYDHLHPFQTGYDKMASVWLSALQGFLPPCAPIPPVITPIPDQDGFAGVPFSYTVTATGNPVPTFSLGGTPPGDMSINPATGEIRWENPEEGSYTVAVTAGNGVSPDAGSSFTLHIGANPGCTDGLTSLWKLDETAGPDYDDYFDSNDGACVGQCPQAASGRVGGAQLFNGSTSGINVPAGASMNWGKDDSFTIEYWMKKGTPCTGNEVALGRDATSTGTKLHWWTGCREDGKAGFTLIAKNNDGFAAEDRLRSTTTVVDDQWHHIVAVRDGVNDQNRLYVDGTLEHAEAVNYFSGFDSSTAPLNIGWLNLSPFFHFDGLLDEVAVYGRALSDNEILEHFAVGSTGVGSCHPDVLPVITTQPTSLSVLKGQPASFSVAATGSEPLQYAWKKDGTAIPRATSNSYSISSAVEADAGSYTCTVKNEGGEVTSNPATLTVVVQPVIITTQPGSLTVLEGDPASFSVAATGAAPLSYQWSKDGVAISGATGSTLTIPAATVADAGSYTCTVRDAASQEVTSSEATLGVTPSGITITLHPVGREVVEGYNAKFATKATGMAGTRKAKLTYQWYKNGQPIPGATRANYTTPPVVAQGDNGAQFQCRITNATSGGSVWTNAAALSVQRIVITAQPASVTVPAARTAKFSVKAKGPKGAKLTYQWYRSNGGGWEQISGATRNSLSMTKVSADQSGLQFLCEIRASNGAGPLQSGVATLTGQKNGT
jgi:lysophospholipase L1-like esterase